MRFGATVAAVVAVVLAAALAWPRAEAGRAGRTSRATASPATASPAAPSPRPSLSPGTLVDADDFTGTAIDRSKWEVYQAPASNHVSQWLTSMVTVADGELRIAGHGNSPDGVGNVSGGVCWCRGLGNQAYGIWQVRARFAAGTGYGQAILLWPESNRWPQDGELDFVETPGGPKTTAIGTVHWGADNQQDARKASGDFTAWHTYAVEWRPTFVTMSIDGRVYYDSAKSARHPAIPTGPMQLAIQQEPGPFGHNWVPAPNGSTPDQVVMHIDWVRIYR
jgi:endo-1,3-1,4-beta-glycanase ExoK